MFKISKTKFDFFLDSFRIKLSRRLNLQLRDGNSKQRTWRVRYGAKSQSSSTRSRYAENILRAAPATAEIKSIPTNAQLFVANSMHAGRNFASKSSNRFASIRTGVSWLHQRKNNRRWVRGPKLYRLQEQREWKRQIKLHERWLVWNSRHLWCSAAAASAKAISRALSRVLSVINFTVPQFFGNVSKVRQKRILEKKNSISTLNFIETNHRRAVLNYPSQRSPSAWS